MIKDMIFHTIKIFLIKDNKKCTSKIILIKRNIVFFSNYIHFGSNMNTPKYFRFHFASEDGHHKPEINLL